MSPEQQHAKTSGENGLTMMELVIVLAIMGIVGLLFHLGYKALARGTTDISATSDMQQKVKALGNQIENDVKRAGFGLGGASAFNTLGAKELAFNFKDLPGASCAAGQTANIHYSMVGNSLVRELSCNGAAKPKKITAGGRDSLNLSFRYLDNTGKTAPSSALVRTIEYTVEIFSGRDPKAGRKKRVSSGSVSIVNNG